MTEPPSSRGASVLIVEDDPQIRESIQWLLEEEGWRVDTAADGQQALDSAAATRPALIVLDMGLPILNGSGFAAALRAQYPDPPPILVLTAADRAAERAREVGAAAYLRKPFEINDLARLVHDLLAPPDPSRATDN